MTESILRALSMAFAMGWEILWPLIVGFALSAVVQAVVPIGKRLGCYRTTGPVRSRPLSLSGRRRHHAPMQPWRSPARCSARAQISPAAMAFEMASTNLVAELSIIMLAFLGWSSRWPNSSGAPILVGLLVLLFRQFLSWSFWKRPRRRPIRGIAGRMEGHCRNDMSVTEGTLWQRMTSEKGLTAISHYFVMDWAAGLARHCRRLADRPARSRPGCPPISGSRSSSSTTRWLPSCGDRSVGPLVAVVSFVVGNIPLAAVLWNGPPRRAAAVARRIEGVSRAPEETIVACASGKPMVGLLVLPTTMAPPRLSIRSAKTQEAFTVKFFSARMPPKVAGQPGLKSNRSLIATGTPCRGPKGSPASTAFSASRARARASSKAV